MRRIQLGRHYEFISGALLRMTSGHRERQPIGRLTAPFALFCQPRRPPSQPLFDACRAPITVPPDIAFPHDANAPAKLTESRHGSRISLGAVNLSANAGQAHSGIGLLYRPLSCRVPVFAGWCVS